MNMRNLRAPKIVAVITVLTAMVLVAAIPARAASIPIAGQTTVQIVTNDGQLVCTREAGITKCLGVPYASPPIGNLRLRAPAPVTPWAGVHDATQLASPCLQAKTEYEKAQQGAEDCLYLNIYSPAPAARKVLPVIVWLHGGGFINGSGNAFNGSYLAAAADAVVVTVNYRLGPFGWLGLPSLATEAPDHSTGNYGLLDSIAALRWVKNNIAAFGGNPDLVTISGQSAGGEQVLALLASPYAKGLFQRAIAMSAPATEKMPTLAQEAAGRDSFLQEIGCAGTVDQPGCLRQVPAQKMLDAANETWNLMKSGLGWTPVIDGAVFPDQWLTIFKTGHFNAVPVMIGSTALEGNLPIAISENAMNRQLDQADIQHTMKRMGPIAGLVDDAYPASEFPSAILRMSHILTDLAFIAGENRDRLAVAPYVPVYGYEFCDSNAPESHIHARFSPVGCGHDSDLGYIFQWDDFAGKQPNFTAEQWALAKTLDQYWGNFAATGNPNGPGLPPWPMQKPGTDIVQLLHPAAEGGITTSPAGDYRKDHRLNLWDGLNAIGEHRNAALAIFLICVVAVVSILFLAVKALFKRFRRPVQAIH